jgi:hypothetical protein
MVTAVDVPESGIHDRGRQGGCGFQLPVTFQPRRGCVHVADELYPEP